MKAHFRISTPPSCHSAGLDYSAAKEPDWSSRLTRQSDRVTQYIETLVDTLSEMWSTRKDVDLDEVFGPGPGYQRKRRLYYDTDGISEQQIERIHRCKSCNGWRFVVSGAVHDIRKASSIAVVIIPWHACQACRRAAEAEFENACKEKQLTTYTCKIRSRIGFLSNHPPKTYGFKRRS